MEVPVDDPAARTVNCSNCGKFFIPPKSEDIQEDLKCRDCRGGDSE